MSLNYNIIETFKLLSNAFKYPIFYSIIIGCVLLVIILIINKESRIVKYTIFSINLILIILICLYYLKDILTFQFDNFINNIYFYFFNSIIYLILITIFAFKTKYKKINYVLYALTLINLFYSLFITHYLNNITLIVIGNVYPMIKIGNIIYIVYYVLLLGNLIKYGFLTKKI